MRSTVPTPLPTTVPGGMLERAISTPSSGCNRMTGAGAMGVSWLANSEWRIVSSNNLTRLSPYSLFAPRYLRLAVRILAGLRDLHLGVGHHQSAFVGQCHELEAHIDRLGRADRAAAVNAG